MGIKNHDVNDNLEGIAKPVQQKILKELSKQAQEQKRIDQTHPLMKASKYHGNGGTR